MFMADEAGAGNAGSATPAAAPAPASSPAAPPTPAPAPTPSGSNLPPSTGGLKDSGPEVTTTDFSGLFADDADNFGPVVDALANNQPTPPPAAAKPVAAPVQAPPAATVPPTQPQQVPPAPAAAAPGTPPAQTPAQPPAAPAAEAPTAPPAPEGDFGQVLQELEANRDTVIDALASQYFQLTPEESTLLQTDANAVVSKVAARTYFAATANAMKLFKQFEARIPAMIEQYTRVKESNAKAESKFKEMFPDLVKDEYNPTIIAIANAVKTSSPGMKQEDFLSTVGLLVRQKLGITAPPPSAGGPVGQPVVVSQVPAGFVPAAPAASPAAPLNRQGPQDAGNPFEGLGMDFDT